MLSEIRRLDYQKTLVVQPIKPEDLPVIKLLMQGSVSKEACVEFVRDKEKSLHGFVYKLYCCQVEFTMYRCREYHFKKILPV